MLLPNLQNCALQMIDLRHPPPLQILPHGGAGLGVDRQHAPGDEVEQRIGQGENETLWCAWLVDSGDYRYFFAGDTGYFEGFAEYGRRFAPIDVAMLPIGAYAPRWFMAYQHMDPAEAYQAFLDLRAGTLLAMHWGTFDLTDEPLDGPPRELARVVAARAGHDERVRVMAVGERWKVPERRARTEGNARDEAVPPAPRSRTRPNPEEPDPHG